MYNFLLTLTSISTENRLHLQCHVYFVCTVPQQIFKLITFMASWNVKVHFFIFYARFYITHSPKSPSPIWPHYLHIIVILGYTSQNLHNTYTIPLQHRVHWGSFWRPDIGLGMGLPNLGIGDLTGDFKFLILSVGDTPMKNDMSLRDILEKKKKRQVHHAPGILDTEISQHFLCIPLVSVFYICLHVFVGSHSFRSW